MSSHPTRRAKLSKIGFTSPALSALDKTKKTLSKTDNDSTKYEMLKKTTAVPDYTDATYREALSRLRYLLNDSYVPTQSRYTTGVYTKPEESDEDSGVSPVVTDRTHTTRRSPFRRPHLPQRLPRKFYQGSQYYSGDDNADTVNQSSPELIAFIERQEEYIDQLEKEAQYCRDELSQLLSKVKELISENESLQDQQKRGLMKVMFEGVDNNRMTDFQSPRKHRKAIEGPSIVFESRISELEAQLTQSRIDLRKAQEEAEAYKKKLEDVQPNSTNYDFYKQIENLQREKRDLNESLAKLQASINQIREKEMDASKKVQRTLDVVDKTQFEKQQAEMEVYRLKSELELQHDKLLEVLSEQTRKVADERSQAERRYHQHVERLNNELTATRDSLAKMQMEVEKHQRIEEDLKRDLNSKNLTIESVKKELNNKIGSLQKELSAALTERDSLEQELNASKMSSERSERFNKQESSRLQVEISALKKRLDDGDANLIHSRRENLRLLEKISDLEKELTLYKIKLGEQRDPIEDEEQKAREKLINSRISEIEAKHVERVSDLEGLIENQSQVMAQLKAECQSLTQKLEESTARHKTEMDNLQSRLNKLNTKMDTNRSTHQQWAPDKTSKEPIEVATRQNLTERSNHSNILDAVNYNQRFLNEESRNSGLDYGNNKLPTNSQDTTYSTLGRNEHDGGGKDTGAAAVAGGNNDVLPPGNGKHEEKNQHHESQPNNYNTYYQSESQPSTNYQDQSYHEQMSSSSQDRLPFQDQQPSDSSYQEQQPSYHDSQLYQGEASHQDQQKFITHDDPLPSQTAAIDESYNHTNSIVTTAQSIPSEPVEVVAPEPKPVVSEAPKTTASQRFQRAAELSRQSGKLDESSRGRLTTQARMRNSQISRTQPSKPQTSRFK